MQNKNYSSLLIVALIALSFAAVSPALAAQVGQSKGMMGRGGQRPGVIGTVSAISGNTITVSGKQGFNSTTSATTYTVDATNAKITKSNATGTISSIAVGDTVAIQGTINGANIVATTIRDGIMMGGKGVGGTGINGTVSSINGTTITVASKARPGGSTAATTYTVDASSATVTKNGASSAVSNIAVGDNIMVQGTINGINVTAKTIRDGVGQGQEILQGNGQPVVAGSVTAVNGNTITISNKSNVVYTIDATSSKFVVSGVTSPTIANVAVGDNVIIQGTVSGNNVTASSVIDQKAKPATSGQASQKPSAGFMGGVMDFFKHMFGF